MATLDYIYIAKIAAGIAFAVIGYFVVSWIVHRILDSLNERLPQGTSGIIQYVLFYGLYLLLIIIILQSIGINLSAVLAAAGVAGVAIGFAAQTSLSNIISGLMLLIERSFKIGDYIRCDGMQGKVEGIGLLCVTLKTIDNRLIRMPNEHLIKSNVINLTTLRMRLISFHVTVNESAQLHEVLQLLEKVGKEFSYRVKEKPLAISFDVASSAAIALTAQVWVPSSDVIAAQSAFVKDCLEAEKGQKLTFYVGVKAS